LVASKSAPAPRTTRTKPRDFEAALAELETLVATMEDGTLPLAQSLATYQRGVELTRLCQERLAQAEQQVKVLEGDLLRPLDAAATGAGSPWLQATRATRGRTRTSWRRQFMKLIIEKETAMGNPNGIRFPATSVSNATLTCMTRLPTCPPLR